MSGKLVLADIVTETNNENPWIRCYCDAGYTFVYGNCDLHKDINKKELSLKEIVSLKEKLDMLLTKFDNLVYSLQLQEGEDGKYSKR